MPQKTSTYRSEHYTEKSKNMDWNKAKYYLTTTIAIAVIAVIMKSCAVSFKFNGTSIDYSKIKTISISEFTNTATLVYPPLVIQLNEALQDIYRKQTRLNFVNQGGDLEIEGEVTGYTLTPLSIQSDAYAAETRLTMTVRVRFTNNVNPDEDFETNFTAFQNFESSKMLNDVQDELIGVMIEEIVDQIYNKTVANW